MTQSRFLARPPNPNALTRGMILYIAVVGIFWAITMAHAALH